MTGKVDVEQWRKSGFLVVRQAVADTELAAVEVVLEKMVFFVCRPKKL